MNPYQISRPHEIDHPHAPIAHSPAAVPVAPEVLTEVEKARAESRSRLAALAVTVLIHVLVFAALAWIIIDHFQPEPPEISIIPAPQGDDPIDLDRKIFHRNVQRKPAGTTSKAFSVVTTPAPSPVTLVSLEIPSETFGDAFGDGFGSGVEGFGPGGGGPFTIPDKMKGRCNVQDRLKRLRENGGTPALDKKVVAALDWLKSQQNEDGSWGHTYPVAMTGFAVLAFSGHCETVDSPKYGPTLVKAINYLVDRARGNNGLLSSGSDQHAPYEHGIATYALAEAYSLNKNARTKVKPISPALKNAVPVIIEGQTKGGGWLYGYRKAGTGDLSISGWNIQALKAAELTGIKIADLPATMKRALVYLKSAVTSSGLYRYRIRDNDRGRLSLTGVGILCARMLGETMANEDKSLDAILARRPRSFRSADLYALYYHSQACFQRGGEPWEKYNDSYQKLVIDSQENDGSWPIASGHLGAAQADAKIYHTCLCTLMLEVYYRYLPATDL